MVGNGGNSLSHGKGVKEEESCGGIGTVGMGWGSPFLYVDFVMTLGYPGKNVCQMPGNTV